MSLFYETLEETRLTRATSRVRNLVLVLVGVAVFAATLYVFADIDRQLDRASSVDSDNLTWSIAQVEVDTLKLQRAVAHATNAPDDPARLDSLRLLFDIFYSRFNILARSDQLATLPINHELRADLWAEGGFFDRVTPLMDGDDATLAAALPALSAEMALMVDDVRRHVVSSLQAMIATGVVRRDELRASLQGFAAAALGLMGVLAGFALVIVQQNRAQQRRTETAERAVHNLRVTIENSLDAVVIADWHGTVTDCNRSAETLFGRSRDDMRGHRLSDLLFKDGFDDPLSALHDTHELDTDPAATDLRKGRIEMSGRHRDGRILPVEVALTEAKGASGERMCIAFVRDISERIEREASLRRASTDALKGEEAKSRFLAVMSHEMRTPLNGLIAATELLQNSTALDQRQAWLSEIVLSCGWAALDQVNNVLELTRLGGNQAVSYQSSVFSPVQVVRDLILQNQPQAAKRSNLLHFDEPDTDVPLVSAPRQLYLRVLYNLLGNAIKFTDGGSVTVSMTAQRTGNALHIVVNVIDTGIGIAEADLERIFHNFETLDASYARMREGTGLGLGIAKLSAEALGGEIRVRSALGKGSTFTLDVTLPVAQNQTQTDRAATATSQVSDRHLSILVVEDNPINSLLLTEMLHLWGHVVTNAADGLEAVEATRATAFDLILMDISMPRMDGLEATRHIRAEGLSRDVPIIGVTANASPDRLPEFLASGMNDVLVKPITRSALLNLIENQAKQMPPSETPLPAAMLDPHIFAETRTEMGLDFVQALATRVIDESIRLTGAARQASAPPAFGAIAATAHDAARAAAAIGLGGLYHALTALESAVRALDSQATTRALADIDAVLPHSVKLLAEHGLSVPTPA